MDSTPDQPAIISMNRRKNNKIINYSIKNKWKILQHEDNLHF